MPTKKQIGSELEKAIIGYIAPIGSDLTTINNTFEALLKDHDLDVRSYKLSAHFEKWLEKAKPRNKAYSNQIKKIVKFIKKNQSNDKFREMKAKIDAGDLICEMSPYGGEALIRFSIKDILGKKTKKKKHEIVLLRQLKRSAEVALLRKRFGDGLFLVGLYAPKETRQEHLIASGMSEDEAVRLIKLDEGKGRFRSKTCGQEMQKIFSRADAFLDVSSCSWKENLIRISELLLGNPFIAPNPEEHAMFMAFAASLRSLDLSRQVGAVITNPSFDILGTGFNEAPAPGGGHYDNDSEFDGRDFSYKGCDTNQAYLIEVVSQIQAKNSFKDLGKNKRSSQKWLMENKDSKLNSTLDFGRPVHAEMSAILACARGGISTKGTYMFATTFPCQNCAKHIIAAGITRVYFIEPYPKSLTLNLHNDAIFLNDSLMNGQFDKVELRPYVGIGPRRFFDLFALNSGNGINLKRKNDKTGMVLEWPRDIKNIRSDGVDGGFPRVAIPQPLSFLRP